METESQRRLLIFLSIAATGLLLSGSVIAIGVDQSTTDGQIVSTTHPDIVSQGESFDIVVDTEHTSATTVEIVGDGFDVDLSSSDSLETVDDKIRFIDPDRSSSTYTISVTVTDSQATTGEIRTWVNNEEMMDADDQTTSTFTIAADSDDSESVVQQETVLRSGSTVAINSSGSAAVSVTDLSEDTVVSDISDGGAETADGILWNDLSGLPDTVSFKLTPPTDASEVAFIVDNQLVTLSVVESSAPDDLPSLVSDEQFLAVANDEGEIEQAALADGINQWFVSDDNRINGVHFSQTELSQLINYWFVNQ